MPTITLIEFNGREHQIEAETGKSLMQNAMDNMVPVPVPAAPATALSATTGTRPPGPPTRWKNPCSVCALTVTTAPG
jgi:hypothetical protein